MTFTYVSSQLKAEALVSEVKAAGDVALAIKADSASEGDIRNAVATAVRSLGPLDVFVNSAGLFLSADIATLKTEDLDRLLAVNVRLPSLESKRLRRR